MNKTHDEIMDEVNALFLETDWASHDRHTVEDWQHEVSSGDTRQGYSSWLYNMLANEEEGE